MSIWASISKSFCNYSIGNILLSWSPFLELGLLSVAGLVALCGLVFFVCPLGRTLFCYFHDFCLYSTLLMAVGNAFNNLT